MSKRLVVRLALVIVALSAVTLLQGCCDLDDDFAYSFMWTSSDFQSASGTSPVLIQVSSVRAGW